MLVDVFCGDVVFLMFGDDVAVCVVFDDVLLV